MAGARPVPEMSRVPASRMTWVAVEPELGATPRLLPAPMEKTLSKIPPVSVPPVIVQDAGLAAVPKLELLVESARVPWPVLVRVVLTEPVLNVSVPLCRV